MVTSSYHHGCPVSKFARTSPIDTCIALILLYGSEVWAPFSNLDWKSWESTETEKVHTQFLKRLLGVNGSTTSLLVRGEMGRHSLLEKITLRNINYIKYVENKQAQSLVNQAVKYEAQHSQDRKKIYSILLKHNNNNVRETSPANLKRLIWDSFDNDWNININMFPKADTYKSFKKRFGRQMSDLCQQFDP